MLARDAAFKGAVDGKPDAVNKANAAIAKRKFDEATQQDRVTLGDPALAASSQKLRGYADGGKVVKRKPNGKAC